MANLIGQYELANSQLTKIGDDPVIIKLASRKVPTPQKPKFYLLLLFPGGGCKYISSLYPVTEWPEITTQAYSMDWQRQSYVLVINPAASAAIICQYTPKNPISSIINMGFGAKNDPTC
jgi:hypothetical protein